MPAKLKIAIVSPEISPFSKSGGLGDVVAALPKKLRIIGHDAFVITPLYNFIKKKSDEGAIKLETIEYRTVITLSGQAHSCRFFQFMPQNKNEIPIYFVDQNELFSDKPNMYGYNNDNLRFFVFNKAALDLIKFIELKPDIIHAHDWQSGLIPEMIKTFTEYQPLKQSAIIYTIHNLAYQFGHNWWEIPDNERDTGENYSLGNLETIEKINFMKRGIIYADAINTVSERYAQEALTPEFGQGLEKNLQKRKNDFYGIINGIDYAVYNPAFDKNIYVNYDIESIDKKKKNKMALQEEVGLVVSSEIPLLGMVHRLTEQKGFDLIIEILDPLLRLDVQLAIVGEGDQKYLKYFQKAAKRHKGKVYISPTFTESLASKMYAASDIFLMPSRFEPCGISQMISLRYGSIPVVNKTGGLSDTITNFDPETGKGNGFLFTAYTKEDFLIALTRAIETYHYPIIWQKIVKLGMGQSYSWTLPSKKYLALYRKTLAKKLKGAEK